MTGGTDAPARHDRTFYSIRAKEKPADTYVVVLNWFAELKAKAGK